MSYKIMNYFQSNTQLTLEKQDKVPEVLPSTHLFNSVLFEEQGIYDKSTCRTNLSREWKELTGQSLSSDSSSEESTVQEPYEKMADLRQSLHDEFWKIHREPQIPKDPFYRSAIGEAIGNGVEGTVYNHGKDEELVVKQAKDGVSLTNEFEIGQKLDSPYLVKILRIHGDSQLIMHKINGQMASDYSKGAIKLEDHQTSQFLNEIKEVIKHLFEKNIVWADVNNQNIFYTNDGHLTICDVGCWDEAKDSTFKSKRLLLGAMEALGSIIKSSKVRTSPVNRELEYSIIFPKTFFNEQLRLVDVHSKFAGQYDECSWFSSIVEKIDQMPSDKEKLDFVLSYVDQVIENFKKSREL